MKIKIMINGRSVEIEIHHENMGYCFKHDYDSSQLINLISKTIEELKQY
jgi:hypothetical protein